MLESRMLGNHLEYNQAGQRTIATSLAAYQTSLKGVMPTAMRGRVSVTLINKMSSLRSNEKFGKNTRTLPHMCCRMCSDDWRKPSKLSSDVLPMGRNRDILGLKDGIAMIVSRTLMVQGGSLMGSPCISPKLGVLRSSYTVR